MKQFLGKVKFWMDKFLSIACAVLLSFMTILVLIQVSSTAPLPLRRNWCATA